MELLTKILTFVLNSLLHIWPYLVITIPIAVAVQLSEASRLLNRIIGFNPFAAILVATLIGALSPFCSCGVIPVITALLIAGVPLAPVMSFWIASPSMDPEIFFLSASVIGFQMSVWRLVATFAISLSAGLLVHFALKSGWINASDVRVNQLQKSSNISFSFWEPLRQAIKKVRISFPGERQLSASFTENQTVFMSSCCSGTCSCNPKPEPAQASCYTKNATCSADPKVELPFKKRLLRETWKAFFMTTRFMTLAFLINALIIYCLPADIFTGILANNGPFSVLIAALVGIPVYTSNITALPLVSGLLTAGMNPGAAIAFLIAGPVTTLPAMSAVWGLVSRKVFLLYLLIPFVGAVLFGWLYNMIA